jgi:hypothetical protein
MTGDEATLRVIDALEALGVPYMVVGSLSSNVYGVPRSTQDADFVVQLGSEPISRLINQLGPSFRLDPQMTFETTTLTKRHILEVVGIPFKIELFHLSDDPHDQERFRRHRRMKTLNREVNLPTAEDVIITKLRWWQSARRSKDWDDARDVVAVQGRNIDWAYVYDWCDRHDTRGILDEIRNSIPAVDPP